MHESVTMTVDGMHCERCVHSVESVLRALPGVLSVEVTLASGRVDITHDAQQCRVDAMRAAIEQAGFDVR